MKKLLASLLITLTLSVSYAPAHVPVVQGATDIANSSLATGLVSYWLLEEASGTRVDVHGSNNLTDNNTVLSATAIQGDGADFERTNSEYLNISDASQSGLDITSDIAFSFWINLETNPSSGNQVAISKWTSNAGDSAYFVAAEAGNLLGFQVKSGSTVYDLNTSLTWSTATWYHIVVSYDASAGTATHYVNGTSNGTATGGPTSINNSGAEIALGRLRSGVWHLDGILDEVGIWNRELTSGEVSSLYNSGAGIPYEAAASPRRIINVF